MAQRVGATLLGATLLVAGCAGGDRAATAPAPARVVVETRHGSRHTVAVEIARSEAERSRGLMLRSSLAADAGMLFVFDEQGEHSFWMKNTLIPLDMLFIDEGGRVVGIVQRATPGSEEPRSGGPCRFVLEVEGGWAAARGVAPGDQVRFENVPFP